MLGSCGVIYKVSVDGTDCRIQEPTPFSTIWYSHKHNGAGVRYEIAVSVFTGRIVWVNGPFPCGSYSDLRIFRRNLKKMLDQNEKVIADRGYRDSKCVYFPNNLDYPDSLYSTVRARHEIMNKRLKQFKVITETFRHDLSLHGTCFHAVANLTELMIRNGSPLFEI